MTNRRETSLEAAVRVLKGRGMRALTHRAVDSEADVPVGSTADYFATREPLLEAIVDWVPARERANVDEVATTVLPTTPAELARVVAATARDGAGVHRHRRAAVRVRPRIRTVGVSAGLRRPGRPARGKQARAMPGAEARRRRR